MPLDHAVQCTLCFFSKYSSSITCNVCVFCAVYGIQPTLLPSHVCVFPVIFFYHHIYVYFLQYSSTLTCMCFFAVDGFGMPSEGMDEDLVGGDEEGGGWDVGDDDLDLPPDLVSNGSTLMLLRLLSSNAQKSKEL